jgi:hypothetical protein
VQNRRLAKVSNNIICTFNFRMKWLDCITNTSRNSNAG